MSYAKAELNEGRRSFEDKVYFDFPFGKSYTGDYLNVEAEISNRHLISAHIRITAPGGGWARYYFCQNEIPHIIKALQEIAAAFDPKEEEK